MKLFQIIAAIFFLSACASAQNKLTYTVSSPYEVIDAKNKYYFNSIEKKKSIYIKVDGGDIYMQSFDTESMKELKRELISDMPKGFDVEHVDWFQDRLYLYYGLYDKKNKTEQLFVREIDVDQCDFKGEAKTLIAIKGKLTGSPIGAINVISFGVKDKFAFKYSVADERLLIQCRSKPKKRNDSVNRDVIGMYVFDYELNELAGSQIEMPYTEKKMDILSYCPDSDGYAYILAKIYKDDSTDDHKGKGDNKRINYYLELMRVDVFNKEIAKSKVEFVNKYITEAAVFQGPDNTMLCVGGYTGEVKNFWDRKVDGLFVIKTNQLAEIMDKKFYEIPVGILNQYETIRTKRKNTKKEKKDEAELRHLTLDELYLNKDGSILLIGEQFYGERHVTGKGRIIDIFHYDDILVTKIDYSGDVNWMKRLPKRQQSGKLGGGLGYDHMVMGDNHYFVFLDNVKNKTLSKNKRPSVHADGAGGYLTAYKVNDKSGELDKYSILNTDKIRKQMSLHQFSTDRVLKVSESEFMVEFYKKKKEDILVKVAVK